MLTQLINKKIVQTLTLVFIMNFPPIGNADTFPEKTLYHVCFTPGQDCTQLLIDQINRTKRSIYVQAYSFTSAPIAKAIVDAKHRGVDVNIILDKSQVNHNRYSSAAFFMHQGVPVWIDYKPAIAHNKIMIFDDKDIATGSFNFTKAAQMKNAENLLIISDGHLAKLYKENWLSRRRLSMDANAYRPHG